MAKGKVVTLVQKNQRERVSVAQFLRECADEIDNDGKTFAGVVILHSEEGDLFRTRSRRCNMSKLEAVGLMQMATSDVCTAD